MNLIAGSYTIWTFPFGLNEGLYDEAAISHVAYALNEQKLGRWQVISKHLGSQEDPINIVQLNIITSVMCGRQDRDL